MALAPVMMATMDIPRTQVKRSLKMEMEKGHADENGWDDHFIF
ncbi:MAG: hypothetical protein PHN98_04350 [Smithellaceae bacterium]|jgi:hypothetical protein|nr:hypothetical protein [Smithellaceae bacterium]